MTISQKIKMALAYKGMSEADLARAVGSSPQAFNQRMKTGKFSSEEMEKIAHCIALTAKDFEGTADEVKATVAEICKKFPMFV